MKSSEFLRILKQDGWYVLRQSGSHMIMKHPVKANIFLFHFTLRKN
jgi:predicted RNA binding protein YcfA (HicA-like mRNA interferase family)